MLTIVTMVMICFAARATDDDKSRRVDDIKAVFIYKFTGYITWPDDEAETFTIAVLGSSRIIEPLKEIAQKRKVDSREIVIRECTELEDISGSHILLISEAEEDHLDAILRKAETEKMLTVADSPGFAEKGVAIDFVSEEDRVGFEMNLSALKRSGLKVSSQLVKLATLVEEDRQLDARGPSK